MSQKISVSCFLNCVPTVLYTTANVASLPFTISGTLDPGLLHGFLATAQTMNIHMVSISTSQGLPLGLQWQHRSQTSIWSSAASWPTDIHMASDVSSIDHRLSSVVAWATDVSTALDGQHNLDLLQQDHGPKDGPRQQHRATLKWLQVVA